MRLPCRSDGAPTGGGPNKAWRSVTDCQDKVHGPHVLEVLKVSTQGDLAACAQAFRAQARRRAAPNGRRRMPRSQTMAVMRRAGVTSNAGE